MMMMKMRMVIRWSQRDRRKVRRTQSQRDRLRDRDSDDNDSFNDGNAYGNDGNGNSAGHVRVFQFGVPCSPPAVPMHAGEVVGGLGECDGFEKIPHLSTCTIACNTAEGYYVEGPAMCNQGTLIGGLKCLCTKGHPRPWHGALACQKRMGGIHVPGTFHDEL